MKSFGNYIITWPSLSLHNNHFSILYPFATQWDIAQAQRYSLMIIFLFICVPCRPINFLKIFGERHYRYWECQQQSSNMTLTYNTVCCVVDCDNWNYYEKSRMYVTTVNGKLLLIIPPLTTSFSRHAFSCTAPTVWNELPFTVRETNTLGTFKHRLQTSLHS